LPAQYALPATCAGLLVAEQSLQSLQMKVGRAKINHWDERAIPRRSAEDALIHQDVEGPANEKWSNRSFFALDNLPTEMYKFDVFPQHFVITPE